MLVLIWRIWHPGYTLDLAIYYMLSIGTSSQREDVIILNIYWIYNPPPTNRGNQMFTGIPHPINAIWYLGWGVDPMYNTWMFERIYIYIFLTIIFGMLKFAGVFFPADE